VVVGDVFILFLLLRILGEPIFLVSYVLMGLSDVAKVAHVFALVGGRAIGITIPCQVPINLPLWTPSTLHLAILLVQTVRVLHHVIRCLVSSVLIVRLDMHVLAVEHSLPSLVRVPVAAQNLRGYLAL